MTIALGFQKLVISSVLATDCIGSGNLDSVLDMSVSEVQARTNR